MRLINATYGSFNVRESCLESFSESCSVGRHLEAIVAACLVDPVAAGLSSSEPSMPLQKDDSPQGQTFDGRVVREAPWLKLDSCLDRSDTIFGSLLRLLCLSPVTLLETAHACLTDLCVLCIESF